MKSSSRKGFASASGLKRLSMFSEKAARRAARDGETRGEGSRI